MSVKDIIGSFDETGYVSGQTEIIVSIHFSIRYIYNGLMLISPSMDLGLNGPQSLSDLEACLLTIPSSSPMYPLQDLPSDDYLSPKP